MSTTGSSLFLGNSRYSSDFQAIIDRAVALASLPITQLKREQETLNSQSAALTALDIAFTAVETALAGVESAVGSSSYEAVLSGGAVATVTLGAGAMEGNYSIEVTSLGAYSTAISKDTGLPKVTDPKASSISEAETYTLYVNGVAWALKPAANTLASLASTINSSGAAVRATVVNVGSSSAPDYRLSLESTKLGPITLALSDGSQELVETQVTGSNATYRVNGVAAESQSDSRTITLAPGITLQLTGTSESGKATNITVTRPSSALASALASFAAAYNNAMDELEKHRGQAGGALSGQHFIYTLSRNLRQMIEYADSESGISGLTELGFTFDRDGRIYFNTMDFMAKDLESSGQVVAFLGSTLGGGFLRSASQTIQAATNPVWGRVRTELDAVAASIARTEESIAETTEQIEQMEISLQEQMAAADALIAQMEQQYTYITYLVEAMRASKEDY